MSSCRNCGLEHMPPGLAFEFELEVGEDEIEDERLHYCSCDLCEVCGQDTHGGMASCACDRPVDADR